jgi:hypothetical protein
MESARLAGPKQAVSGPKGSRPGSNRAIADNWRGLYGSDPFSSIDRIFERSGFRFTGETRQNKNLSKESFQAPVLIQSEPKRFWPLAGEAL